MHGLNREPFTMYNGNHKIHYTGIYSRTVNNASSSPQTSI